MQPKKAFIERYRDGWVITLIQHAIALFTDERAVAEFYAENAKQDASGAQSLNH